MDDLVKDLQLGTGAPATVPGTGLQPYNLGPGKCAKCHKADSRCRCKNAFATRGSSTLQIDELKYSEEK